jgi:hypothetical protein
MHGLSLVAYRISSLLRALARRRWSLVLSTQSSLATQTEQMSCLPSKPPTLYQQTERLKPHMAQVKRALQSSEQAVQPVG